VGYSDFGHHHPEGPSHDNVVVVCGPMISSRLLSVVKDKLAKRYRLRIIHPDRFGMGKTSAVPIDQRLEAWQRASSTSFSPEPPPAFSGLPT